MELISWLVRWLALLPSASGLVVGGSECGPVAGSGEHNNEHSVSVKAWDLSTN
jgi:hypothetical protein